MSMKKFIPLNDYILLKKKKVELKTVHGIIIPEAVKREVLESEVLDSSDISKKETRLENGDIVLHRNGVGTPFQLDGDDMLAVKYTDIIAKVVNE